MSWGYDLHSQVLEAFRDAQQRPGELDTSEEPKPVVLAALEVEKPETTSRVSPKAAQSSDRVMTAKLGQLIDFTPLLRDRPDTEIDPISSHPRRRIVRRIA